MALYQEIKQYIIDNNITLQQLSNATQFQVINVLNLNKEEARDLGRCWNGMKNRYKEEKKEEVRTQELVDFKTLAKNWITDRYPDAQFERENREIKIYLDGGQE